MNKNFFVLIIFFLFGLNTNAKSLRELYNKSADSEACFNQFYELAQAKYESDPTNQLNKAYYASAIMVGSKFTFNPINKLSKFNKGKALLEESLLKATEDLEIRYIRFTMQVKTPMILAYKSKINEDKEILKTAIKNKLIAESPLGRDIQQFMIDEKIN